MKQLHGFTTLLIIVAATTMLPARALSQNSGTKASDNVGFSINVSHPDPFQNENYFNTASVEIKGNVYKLVLIGDLVPRLTVDGMSIAKKQLRYYADIVDSLANVIWKRQTEESERRDAILENQKLKILNDLIEKSYFSNITAIKSFYLTSTQFLVNGQNQDAKIFSFFKTKYIKAADTVFYYESNNQ